MGLSRFANQRDANEQEIVAALEQAGCSVWRLDEPVDLIVGRAGVNYFLEVKMPGAGLTDKQTDFHVGGRKEWRGQKAVVHDAEEALAEVGIKIVSHGEKR